MSKEKNPIDIRDIGFPDYPSKPTEFFMMKHPDHMLPVKGIRINKEDADPEIFTISTDELDHLHETMLLPYKHNMHDPTWIKAFKRHNEISHQGKFPLSLECRGCYIKVFSYIKTLFENDKK